MIRRAILIASALAVAGCATRPSGPPAGGQGATSYPPALPGAVSPATYVAQAASIDLFVVRASELARSRAQSPRLRRIADQLVVEHKGLAAQLSFAGRRLNLLPAATMLPQHQAMFDELAASGAFDQTYLRQQRAIHGAALSLHADYARRGSSPTLRPIATNAAAVERQHLALLRNL